MNNLDFGNILIGILIIAFIMSAIAIVDFFNKKQ